MHRRLGFSLLELMIGVFLIASTSLVFLKALNLFNKETVFYSEHFLASSLGEKVMETCYQELEVNPYGFQALGLVDQDENTLILSSPITDGQTNFFKNPEISNSSTPYLYMKTKNNFISKVVCEGSIKDYYEVVSGFKWNAKTGSGEINSVCRYLAFDGEKDFSTTYSMSDEYVEKELLAVVFRSSATSISSVVDSIGGQELAMAIGRIYYSCFNLLSSEEFYERCRKLEVLEGSPCTIDSDLYEKCTQGYFDLAKDLLHLLMYLNGELKIVKEKQNFLSAIKDQHQPNVQRYLIESMNLTRRIEYCFIAAISKLASRYEKAFNNEPLVRKRKRNLLRLFHFYRVLYACRNNSTGAMNTKFSKVEIENQVRSFLHKLKLDFEKNNPSISRLANQDLDFFNKKKLAEAYFVPATIEKLVVDVEELTKLSF